MQLNCKAIKKVATPHPPTAISTSIPLFQSYPPFLANFLVPPPPPPNDSIFGSPYLPPPFNKGEGGSDYEMSNNNKTLFIEK